MACGQHLDQKDGYARTDSAYTECPRCHFTRTHRDFGAPGVCPRCGVTYKSGYRGPFYGARLRPV